MLYSSVGRVWVLLQSDDMAETVWLWTVIRNVIQVEDPPPQDLSEATPLEGYKTLVLKTVRELATQR